MGRPWDPTEGERNAVGFGLFLMTVGLTAAWLGAAAAVAAVFWDPAFKPVFIWLVLGGAALVVCAGPFLLVPNSRQMKRARAARVTT